jgi:hypothetical protein
VGEVVYGKMLVVGGPAPVAQSVELMTGGNGMLMKHCSARCELVEGLCESSWKGFVLAQLGSLLDRKVQPRLLSGRDYQGPRKLLKKC